MFKKISLYKRVVVFVFLLTGIPFIFTACGGNPQTAAKAKLEKQNITVSPQSLFQAIKMGDVPNTFLLLEAGIDVNIRVDDKTPLIAAIELKKRKVVDHLLTQWVPDVTMKQSNGQTALMAAVENANEGLVTRLLSLGADVDAALDDGITPLMMAVTQNNFDMVSLLLKQNANVLLRSKNDQTALNLAMGIKNQTIYQLLVNKGADETIRDNATGWTPLIKAINKGDTETIWFLIKSGANINAYTQDNYTVLMSAVFSGDPTLIDYLLKQNVAFNVRANNGWTALFYATELLQPDIAKTLLEQGADPNITGFDGFSPLMSAVLNGSYPLVEILLESGADPNLKDINNESAFSIAEDKNEEEILGLLEKAKS